MATNDVLTFDLSLEIQRPPTAVFALLADIQDFEPIPRDAVVELTKEPSGPPAGSGSVLSQHETLRLRAHLRWPGPFVERGLRPRLHQRLSDIKTILEERAA